MLTRVSVALVCVVVGVLALGLRPEAAPRSALQYTSDGQLRLPKDYREWVFLSSGFDMSYSGSMQMDHHIFDNVFVNPDAYVYFVKNGTWPDKTILILEARRADNKDAITKSGNYQGNPVMGLEAHVKDKARFAGGWAFFGFNSMDAAKMIPQSADCYSCHSDHGALDTTFVQFYPTLLPIAKDKGTLTLNYRSQTSP